MLTIDKELQSIKTKNNILINTKTAKEIEDIYQQYRKFIVISTRTFNNVEETYTVMENFNNNKRIYFCYKNNNRNAKSLNNKKSKKHLNYVGEFETEISMESPVNTSISQDEFINTKKINIGCKKKLIGSNNNIIKMNNNDKKLNEVVANNENVNLDEMLSSGSTLYNELKDLNDPNLNLVSYNLMFKKISSTYLLKIQGTEKEKTIYNQTKNEIRKLRQLVFKKLKRRNSQRHRKSKKETIKILMKLQENNDLDYDDRKDTKKSTNQGSELSKKNNSLKNSNSKNRNNLKVNKDPKHMSIISVKDPETNEISSPLTLKKNKQALILQSFKLHYKNKDMHDKRRIHANLSMDTSKFAAIKKNTVINAILKTEENLPNYFDLNKNLRNSVVNRKCSNKIHLKKPKHPKRFSSLDFKKYDGKDKKNHSCVKFRARSRACTCKNIKFFEKDTPKLISINPKKRKIENENSEKKEKLKISGYRKSMNDFHPPVIVNNTTTNANNTNINIRFSFPNKNVLLNKKKHFLRDTKKFLLNDSNKNDDICNKSNIINDIEKEKEELNKHINNKINLMKRKHKGSEPASTIKKFTLAKSLSKFKIANKE